ncbi:MAG: PIN domain-containing protein [Oscillospiraceae bacterium]|nr:PIN domain-containing protein [Oscillospiraceae bacterium]
MTALIDTCVIMDLLQNRQPFFDDAYTVLRLAITGEFDGYITAKSAADIHYLTRRCTHSEEESRANLNKLLSIVILLDTTAEDIFHALTSDVSDFEDAIMIETGVRCKVDCIITRNIKDFKGSSVRVLTPTEFIKTIEAEDFED